MKVYNFWRPIVISLIILLLFSCKSKNETKPTITTLLETSESWNGNQLPNYLKGKPEVTILKVVIPSKTKLAIHKHSVINAAVVLKGELSVITEQKDTLHIKTGDAFTEVVDTWHYGINNGNVPAELIVFYAGVEGVPNTTAKQVE
ncbi:cupin domain-containing protein [Dokdonia sp.]|uniref:cupin domain-containing protein n=1 Tax=Dokdonia sp. TaxID=2024995 RepID=UPI0032638A14